MASEGRLSAAEVESIRRFLFGPVRDGDLDVIQRIDARYADIPTGFSLAVALLADLDAMHERWDWSLTDEEGNEVESA